MQEILFFTLPLCIIIVSYAFLTIILCFFVSAISEFFLEICTNTSKLLLDKNDPEVLKNKYIKFIRMFRFALKKEFKKQGYSQEKIITIATNLNMDDIKNNVKKISNIIKYILPKLFFGNPFNFIKKFSNYSWYLIPVLEKKLFKEKQFAFLLFKLMFNYILSFSIVIFLGYGISIYSPFYSIILSILYIMFVISNHLDSFNNNTFMFFGFSVQNNNLSKYITSLICIIISFASVYYNLYKINPNNFICNHHHLSLIDSIYFSVVTFATVGYGEIIPNSNISKILVSTEIMSSIFILIIIVSSYINRGNPQSKITEDRRK